MATDAETIAELKQQLIAAEKERDELKAKLSGEKFGAPLWRGITYIWTNHKADIVNAAIALGAIVYAASKPATVEKHTETIVREVSTKSEPAGKAKADTIHQE